ncbi:hypothetical protein PENSPDRAFT_651860 [Peniophora sp. CONT]|nr:hypothetical protein PENSPDRAFT_651860 [Peniophora sp. CONT]
MECKGYDETDSEVTPHLMASNVSAGDAQIPFSQISTIVRDRAFPLLAETFLFALYSVLTAYFVSKRWMDRKINPLPPFVLWMTLTMFVLFLGYWSIDVYLLWAEVYKFLPQQQTGRKDIYYDGIFMPWSVPLYVQSILQLILVLLGDVVSLWRGYVISGKSPWLKKLVVGTVVLESLVYLWVCISWSTYYLPTSDSGFYYVLLRSRRPVVYLSYAVTGIAQIASTLVIAFKAWVYWKNFRRVANKSPTHGSLAILAIVIETGVTYLLLLVWFATINDFIGRHGAIVAITSSYYFTPLVAMYPTLVVVLVSTRKSVLEPSNKVGAASGDLRFAASSRPSEDHCSRCSGHMRPYDLGHRRKTADLEQAVDMIVILPGEHTGASGIDSSPSLLKAGTTTVTSVRDEHTGNIV